MSAFADALAAPALRPRVLVSSSLPSAAFPEQAAYVADRARLKAAFCTRRAAKSYSVGLDHVRSAIQHGGKHLILGLTRESVRGAFWRDVLHAIDDQWHLGAVWNETRLEMTLGQGSIRLLGMDSNETEMRKALGQKYRIVSIDEAQDFRTDLARLVDAVLRPAMADLGGQISLSGTPSNQIRGLFYDVTTGKRPDWSLHRWSTTQNTAIPAGQTVPMNVRWASEIATMTAANPRVVETPWFRQMYLGEWVIETDSLVYRYAPTRNDYDGVLPAIGGRGRWRYVLGVDLGYNDPTAFTVVAYHDDHRKLYVVGSSAQSGLDITATAQRIRALMGAYDFDRIVVDGSNKQAVEEMKRRHDLPLHPTDKVGKSDFIELLNADLITAQLLLSPDCDVLREEMTGLIWDPRSEKREEHPGCPNHATDSLLYAWRWCYQYLSTEHIPRPALGTDAALALEADEMEQAAVEAHLAAQEVTQEFGSYRE